MTLLFIRSFLVPFLSIYVTPVCLYVCLYVLYVCLYVWVHVSFPCEQARGCCVLYLDFFYMPWAHLE